MVRHRSGRSTAGDVYVVAGTGTAGLIAEPGNNQFDNSTTAVATANPIEPTSVAFDTNGNVLIAGRVVFGRFGHPGRGQGDRHLLRGLDDRR